MHALQEGRSPTAPVVTLAWGHGRRGQILLHQRDGSGVWVDNVFWTPTHPSYPLHGVEDTKLALLDEFRLTESVAPIATQCLWFDGSALPVAKPQTGQGPASHIRYEGRAPVFITTSAEELRALHEAGYGDASMVLRRLSVFWFPHRVAPPAAPIPSCAPCFARFVTQHGH